MGKFYIRVYRDDMRYRTYGCGSRGLNADNLDRYLEGLLVAARRYQKDPSRYFGTELGKKYRFELIKNRNGNKEIYREVEIDLVIPILPTDVHYNIYTDITYTPEIRGVFVKTYEGKRLKVWDEKNGIADRSLFKAVRAIFDGIN